MSYPIYPKRAGIDLNGIWKFKFLERPSAPELKKLNPDSVVCDDVQSVPGCFDSGIKYAGKRGVGIYKRAVLFDAPGRYLLKIGGLGLYARIFFDGKEIGFDDLPYSGVSYVFDVKKAGTHEFAFAVDNRFSYELCPIFSSYYDFYAFGGIYRPLELYRLPGTCFDRCHVTTLNYKDGTVRLDIFLDKKISGTQAIDVAFDGKKSSPFKVKFTAGKGSLELKVPAFKTWTLEAPNLHTVTLSTKDDVIIERFGIREVKTSKGQILLNGKKLTLLGYNRHESHPEFGPALPLPIMIEDLQILKDMNCNFIRGSHYPQSQEFLDLCDEYGFLVWEETLGWGDTLEHLTDKKFQEKQLDQTRLMVKNSCNHPSIIMWGFLNEMHSFDMKCRKIIKLLAGELRKLDPSRPVTFATANIDADKALDLVDVISTNLYPGWYGCGHDDYRPLHLIKPRLDQVAAIVSVPEHRDKPWIISEIGAAGLYGNHDRLKGHWSEDYQADYLKTVCDYVLNSKRAMGLAIWQFTDGRSYTSSQNLNRARGFNNKGTLDEYRRPKLAYGVVKTEFAKKKK